MTDTASPYVLTPFAGARPPAPLWFDEALAVPFETVPLEWDGARLELLCWGEVGRPGLLLLHGNNAHARWWSPIAARLAGQFRVAALSWSGMGGSDWREAYSVAGYADEAMAAADAAELFAAGPPVVVAHSFGGSGALEAAKHHGDLLGGLILVDSLLNPQGGKPALPPKAAHRIHPSLEAGLARFRLAPPQPCDNFYYMDWVARHALKPVTGAEGEEGWTWRIDPTLWSKLEWHDKWSAFLQSRCPIAALTGSRSRLVPQDALPALREQAPQGTYFETVPDAGHHILLDQPLYLAEAISRIAPMLAGSARPS